MLSPACRRSSRVAVGSRVNNAGSVKFIGARAAASPNSEGPSASEGKGEASQPQRAPPSAELRLPKLGYFALADTKAEVYSKAGSEPFDPMKKGGRYQPEFIWNTDWQKALERQESLQRKVDEARARPKEADSGFLSFSRLSDLDRMDVDLSEQLTKRRRADAEAAAARAAAPPPPPAAAKPAAQRRLPVVRPARISALPVFTRKEVARLDRVTRSSARNAPIVVVPELDAEKLRVAEEERLRYEAVKVDQLVWTVVASVAGFAMTYVSYSKGVAASYAVGAAAGFAYLRLLGKSVDAMGGAGLQAGMASQPRLLIPIILGLGYNRFNQLYAEQLGLTLELLPILVGFFTYKLAVVARQYKDVYDNL